MINSRFDEIKVNRIDLASVSLTPNLTRPCTISLGSQFYQTYRCKWLFKTFAFSHQRVKLKTVLLRWLDTSHQLLEFLNCRENFRLFHRRRFFQKELKTYDILIIILVIEIRIFLDERAWSLRLLDWCRLLGEACMTLRLLALYLFIARFISLAE